MKFFAELRRRNVIRVALAYLLISWIVLQIADVAFGVLQLPEWSLTLVAALLALGFLPALIFAWVFELTPDGIKRDEGAAAPDPGHKRLDLVNGAMLAAILGLLGWQHLTSRQSDPAASEAATVPAATEDQTEGANTAASVDTFGERNTINSIAVLPFDNLGGDPENEQFADGLADTILHSLAQIEDLRVIARNSSFAYKGRSVDVREVGKSLGVAHVLEGSVQHQGARIRVIAQLVETDSAGHVWSRTYGGIDQDLFALQDEIAADVAATLQVGYEAGRADLAETDSLLALELVQLARSRLYGSEVQAQISEGESPLELIGLVEEAIAQDPDYLGAWTTLVSIYSFGALQAPGQDSYRENLRGLQETVESMERIAPDHSLTLQARAAYEWRRWNPEKAREYARAALEKNPNLSPAWSTLGLATDRLGDSARALIYYERARELDPERPFIYRMLANASERLGDLEATLAYRREAVRRAPDVLLFREDLINFQANGNGRLDLAVAEALAAFEDSDATGSLHGIVGRLLARLGAYMDAERWIDRSGAAMGDPTWVEWIRAELYTQTGRLDEAEKIVQRMVESVGDGDSGVWRYAEFPRVHICLQRRDFACVRDVLERLYPNFVDPEMAIKQSGIGLIFAATAHVWWALVDANAGRVEALATRCGEVLSAVEPWPLVSPMQGRNMLDVHCHALLGDEAALIKALQAYLDVSEDAWFQPFTRGFVAVDSPFFEAWEDHPEFQRIAAELEARRARQRVAALKLVEAFEAGGFAAAGQ